MTSGERELRMDDFFLFVMTILCVQNIIYCCGLYGLAVVDYREKRISLWYLLLVLCSYLKDVSFLTVWDFFLWFALSYSMILCSHYLFFFYNGYFLFGGGDEKMLALFSILDTLERFSLTLIITSVFLLCKKLNIQRIYPGQSYSKKIPLAPFFCLAWAMTGCLRRWWA